MAGEFYLPNYGAAPSYSFGTPQLQTPNPGNFLPNWGMNSSLVPNGVSLPQGVTDAMRYNQTQQQMAPNNTLGYVNVGISGVSALGNLFLGWQAMRQAQKSAQWQQGMAENNYWNSVKSYNTAVEDRVRGRYDANTQINNADAVNSEVNKRKIGGQ